MEIHVPYGRSYLTANLPDHVPVDVLEPPDVPAAGDPSAVVQAALDGLLDGAAWPDLTRVRSVAIAVNDKTRPVPHQYLLPPLIRHLERLGVLAENITFYISVGTHPPMRPDEYPDILPDFIVKNYRVISHDSEDERQLHDLGRTPEGTPVYVNRAYYQSDFKIVVGNIEPHQFAGFSGGVKTAAIGLAGLKTINHHHALLTHPASQLGVYDTNPARREIEVMGGKIKIHLALNAILNQNRQIVQVLAGDPLLVMRVGVPLSQKISQVAVPAAYGLLVASPGGHPKDINIYQAQKGLGHAVRVARPGGTIILAAACPEGAGSAHYEEWVLGKKSHQDVLEQFNAQGFRVGPHKAYQIAREASRFRILFCTDMNEQRSKALLLDQVRDFQTAVDMGLAGMKPGERVGILPHASSTIPYIDPNGGDS